jgi:iron complex outermembrane receptor protein
MSRNAPLQFPADHQQHATNSARTCAISIAVAAALASSYASAAEEGGLQEITITAQKRAEDLQDAPLSVSALGEDSLSRLAMRDFRDWATYVPGITMSQGLNSRRGGPIAVIRGVTNQVRGGIGDNTANATTAFTIGEIPVFSVNTSMVDLNRIEVLKGPQGTLFGIAAMGGVVRYIPNEARTDAFDAEFGVGAGMIKKGGQVYDAHAIVNVPLIEDVLAVRGVAFKNSNGGFIDHVFPALDQTGALVPFKGAIDPRVPSNGSFKKDSNKTDSVGGRISFTYTPTERFSAKLFAMWQKDAADDSWHVDYNDSRPLIINRFTQSPNSSEYQLTSLELGYDLGFGRVEYIGGHYLNDLSETVDATKLIADQYVRLNGDPYPVPVAFPFITHTKQWTHELRLQGQDRPLFGDMRFDYVLGVFHQNEVREGGYAMTAPTWNLNKGPNTESVMTKGGLIAGATGAGDYTNKAAFVDLTLHLTSKLSLGAGVRYFDQEKIVTGAGYGDIRLPDGTRIADNLDDPLFRADGRPRTSYGVLKSDGKTPRFNLSYHLNEDKMLYATAGSGMRIGSEAPQTGIIEIRPPECETVMRNYGLYDNYVGGNHSDKLWSYDVGFKTTWLDNRLRLNGAAYYVDWKDLQQVVILNSIDTRCSQVIQGNVGGAKITGFELEAVYAPNRSWTLNGSVANANAEISEFVPGVFDSVGDPLEKGDLIRGVPKWTANAGVQYNFPLSRVAEGFSGWLRADWRYVGERINGFGDRNTLRTRQLFLVAEQYRLTDIRLGADSEAWSAQLYVSNVFNDIVMFESMANFFQQNFREVAINQPRTVGFTLSRRF